VGQAVRAGNALSTARDSPPDCVWQLQKTSAGPPWPWYDDWWAGARLTLRNDQMGRARRRRANVPSLVALDPPYDCEPITLVLNSHAGMRSSRRVGQAVRAGGALSTARDLPPDCVLQL
jgi:hypothetical protein